jgi:uncharacterized cofD-like protein
MKNIVAIGGGTGLSTLLRGLKEYPFNITAIVTMTDDGASTGRLRRETGILPPGDIRKCIAALAKNESALLDLFNYRFKQGFGIAGHSMGNLFLTALKDTTGSFEGAVEKASDILNIKGRVLPATLHDVYLGATFENGTRIMGEYKITQYGYGMKIKEVYLSKEAEANPKAVRAIADADYIIVGPGSLYTSIIPNFLHKELKSAYKKSKAPKIYVCNVSTERGETDRFRVSDHINTLNHYGIYFDKVILNSKMFPKGSGDGFVEPVIIDVVGKQYVSAVLSDAKNPLYHDSKKLAHKVADIIGGKNEKLR